MKKLLVIFAAVALVAAAAAVAFADDDAPTAALLQSTDEQGDEAPQGDTDATFRHPVLEDVLDRLVDEGVIDDAQAEAIRDAVADEMAAHRPHLRRHDRFTDRPFGLDLTDEQREELKGAMAELRQAWEGFDSSAYRDLLHDALADGALDDEEVDALMEALRDLVDSVDLTPLSELSPELRELLGDAAGQLRWKGLGPLDVLPDILDDGEISDAELDQLESGLRQMLERFEGELPRLRGFPRFRIDVETEPAASA